MAFSPRLCNVSLAVQATQAVFVLQAANLAVGADPVELAAQPVAAVVCRWEAVGRGVVGELGLGEIVLVEAYVVTTPGKQAINLSINPTMNQWKNQSIGQSTNEKSMTISTLYNEFYSRVFKTLCIVTLWLTQGNRDCRSHWLRCKVLHHGRTAGRCCIFSRSSRQSHPRGRRPCQTWSRSCSCHRQGDHGSPGHRCSRPRPRGRGLHWMAGSSVCLSRALYKNTGCISKTWCSEF